MPATKMLCLKTLKAAHFALLKFRSNKELYRRLTGACQGKVTQQGAKWR
ncbi:hypothetical protein [Paenibacillus silvae]|nr:hypothetical protein [Paenibacillus silvae]